MIKAKHRTTDSYVVIKIFDVRHSKKSDISQFANESSILYKCHHPGIVKVLEVFQTKENIYLVTEHCSGGDLQHHMLNRCFKAICEDMLKSFAHKLGEAI